MTALFAGLGIVLGAQGALPSLESARWIWREAGAAAGGEACALRRVLNLPGVPRRATVLITADNGYELYVNGAWVGADVGEGTGVWQSVERYDVTACLAAGRNVVGIRGIDLGGVRGVLAAVRVEMEGDAGVELVTDGGWRVAPTGEPVAYSHPEFVEGAEWGPAREVGAYGCEPWGRVVWRESSKRAGGMGGASAVEWVEADQDFRWPEGVAFVGEDCSVYVPLRGDAWGVAFRVGDWSRAYTEFDLPCPSKIGRKLYTATWLPGPAAGGGAPGGLKEPQVRLLFDAGAGVLGSPSVTFDGRFLLLAMALGGEKFFHIYRLPVAGGEPERLTEGPFHDIDPVELPDGRIVFTSTRIGTFEEYHQPPARALFRMNADGSDIHPITSTLIFDNEAKVLANGRLVFVRTDNFFDRGKVETHLHSMRPDGTDGLLEFGANTGADYGTRLRAYGYGSPAPLPDLRVAYLSNRGNYVAALGSPELQQRRLPGVYGDLAALADGRLLCTVLRPEERRMVSDVLGVMDPADGRVVRVLTSGMGSIHSPVALGARARPPVIPDYVDRAAAARPDATGFLLCRDARFTTKAKAGWERVRAMRVLGAIPVTTRSSHSHIVHVGHETVELGTVPLAADGSFSVEVPADMPLALQAVDAEGRAELNEMSWLYVRPGERRACLGCHQPRETTPVFAGGAVEALRAPPVRLLGQGDPHRFRGNNPGVTGMMDLQFERFRECASLNRNALREAAEAGGRQEWAAAIEQLRGADEGRRISAAQRLGMWRRAEAAPALAMATEVGSRELRLAAALALATCGTRESVVPLVRALGDRDPVVADAAGIALENLTGQAGFGRAEEAWRGWLVTNVWEELEARLIADLGGPEPGRRAAVVALGHVGGDRARLALRGFLGAEAARNPYPLFEKDNRTDTFTYAADSPWNPRTLQEAVRALGRLRDAGAVPALRDLVAANRDPRHGNLYLVEAAMEALGRVGSAAAERVLIEAFGALGEYWEYVGWYSDHPALYACHASPVHARALAALDELASAGAAVILPQVLRSIPTDPDRALFLANDDYETVVGRLVRRSGRCGAVVETCLALLGDPQATPDAAVAAALSRTHPAWGGHPGPENRAAQVLSVVCRDPGMEARIRAAYERFLRRPEEPIRRVLGNPTWTPVRHWTLFYLARALGNLRSREAVALLAGVLADGWNEARHGRPDPSQPEIHLLQWDYTPCWRAAAAWALGEIGDRRAMPALGGAVRLLDNATDVRHAAAVALGKVGEPQDAPGLGTLAATYPEVSVRRALLRACERLGRGGPSAASLAGGDNRSGGEAR